jgi:hypothetical protein
MQAVSPIRRDFIASHLRSRLSQLHQLLAFIEESEQADLLYTSDVLKDVENGLRQVRKACVEV